LLRSRPVAGANLTAIAITASTTLAMYLSVLYVQGVPGGRVSPLLPTVNLAVIAGSLLGPRLLVRLGGRRTLLVGFTGIATGITLLVILPAGSASGPAAGRFHTDRRRPAAASVASTQTGTDAADPVYRGVAAGVLNSAPRWEQPSVSHSWYPSRRPPPARP
jgi:predicted MFS family arabinose efflux permease